VPDDARDAMLELCAGLLSPRGLLYLNYNAHPGWSVRGLVRDFLMQQTAHVESLEERAELCRQISARVIAPLKDGEHAFTRLMTNELLQATPCGVDEFSALYMAAWLVPVESRNGNAIFLTPGKEEVEITDVQISRALKILQPEWPRGRRVDSLFPDVAEVKEALEFMLRNELVELRCIEPGDFDVSPEPLNALEKSMCNISTSPWHAMTMHAADA